MDKYTEIIEFAQFIKPNYDWLMEQMETRIAWGETLGKYDENIFKARMAKKFIDEIAGE